MKRRIPLLILAVALVGAAVYSLATYYRARRLLLTGIVTTDDVIVSAQIQGRIQQLRVKEGDSVKTGDLLGTIQPQEWTADLAFYANSAAQSAAQVDQAGADLRFQEAQTQNLIKQAEANLAAAVAQAALGDADFENARLNYAREIDLHKQGADSIQAYDLTRTTNDSSKARAEALHQQADAARSALALARANAEQDAVRRAALAAGVHQQAAMEAQKEKAQVRLGYTEIRSPLDGIVDVRAARPGEIVNIGQAILTLINPDDYWVRVDVEESYIDRVHLGDKLTVRLPSGVEREGTVFYRRVDADYATQRDVSRTKRDIKTFEIRLRCDNRDRSLAVGMTAYVTLPLDRR
jgi:HlyD family secretion protein